MRAFSCFGVCLALVAHSLLSPLGVVSETVGINGNQYHDTGKATSSCTRRVTVEGEGDCYYSLKRLVSGTGVTNMNARGLFTSVSGEVVKYKDANQDGEWTLESVPKLGVATGINAPTSRLHVSGEIRASRGLNLYPADQRMAENVRDVDGADSYTRVKQLRVRDFEYHAAYAHEMDMPAGGTVRSVLSQETGKVIPDAVRTLVGQESWGAKGTQRGHLEVDAVQQILSDRLFYDLLAAFQQLAANNEALQAQVNALQAEVTQFKADTSDNFNAAKADRLNLRDTIAKDKSDQLRDDMDLETKLAAEEAARKAKDDAIIKQLDYVSQVFSTYTNYN
jgi:hypothetical protein